MKDSFNREIDYLRISITDRCNFRCVYCMPESGVEVLRHNEILSYGEIIRLVKIMVPLGLKKIKITGGEPLVRKGVVSLIKNLKNIKGIEQVTITTNGVYLAQYIKEFKEIGLDGINISLDTLNENKFLEVTRIGQFNKTIQGLNAAIDSGINTKVNCVPIFSDRDNLIELASLAKDNQIQVRFIEVMPIGMGKNFKFISSDEIIDILSAEFGEPIIVDKKLGNGPATYLTFAGFRGNIGFISAVSHKFCSSCNRLRLTANGFLKTCLQYDYGSNLFELLKNGSSDDEIREVIRQTILQKPMAHHFGEDIKEDGKRLMSQIGG